MLHLEQRVYQPLLLLRAAVALVPQSREKRLPCVLREKGDDQPSQPLSGRLVLLFHGVVWGYDLVAEDAESDLGVQLEVLYQRVLDDCNLPWFVWKEREGTPSDQEMSPLQDTEQGLTALK